MKRILQRLRFRAADEMERMILLKAQRNAYFFLAASLILWSLWESRQVYVHHVSLNPMPGLLLGGAMLVQAFTQLILVRNAVKDDEDSHETGPLMKLTALICAVVALLAMTVSAVVLMGIRA